MRYILSFIVAFVAANVAAGISQMLFPSSLNLTTIIGLFAFIATFFWVKGKRWAGPLKGNKYPDGFNGDYAHDNIAIDQKADKLWVRDPRGAIVVSKNDILRWNIAHKVTGTGHTVNNRLEIHVRDLGRPKLSAPFNRHSDFLKPGATKNAAECEEWSSRLTTWVNN